MKTGAAWLLRLTFDPGHIEAASDPTFVSAHEQAYIVDPFPAE